MLKACKLGVLAPTLYYVDAESSSLFMEFVPGISVKERLHQGLSKDGAPPAVPSCQPACHHPLSGTGRLLGHPALSSAESPSPHNRRGR